MQALCNGTFSDGTSINAANPVFLADVPGSQQFCDFHTFAWNQFLYVTNGSPQFLSMAPWYNLLQPNGSPAPSAYPGGSTALQGGKLDKQQAGDADQLLDVAGFPALYDIRVNQAYYDSLVSQNLYTYTLYAAACAPVRQHLHEPALAAAERVDDRRLARDQDRLARLPDDRRLSLRRLLLRRPSRPGRAPPRPEDGDARRVDLGLVRARRQRAGLRPRLRLAHRTALADRYSLVVLRPEDGAAAP